MMQNKKGVSLIVVLLFMLVATIAATATYRWLTAQNRASASRLYSSESYQASVAGIETARSWMAYNANDVGALIRQYKKGSNVPIRLTNNFAGLSGSSQNFDVWLVGVNTEKSTYKLKLLSKGTSRDGTSSHDEIAILNVDGLFRVQIPSNKKSGIPFHEAFFGGAEDGISLDVTSSIINGDTKFNTAVQSDSHLVVTGDLNVNSNTTRVRELYVNGSLYSCTNFNIDSNVYVKDLLYVNGTMSIGGSLYAGAGVDFSGTGANGKAQCSTGPGGAFSVGGNLTSDADIKMPRHNAATQYVVYGDLVLKNSAKIDFPKYSEYSTYNLPYQVSFLGNMYVSGGLNNGRHIGYEVAPKVVFGSKGKKVYTGPSTLYRISDFQKKFSNYSHWTNNAVYSYWPGMLNYRSIWNTYPYYSKLDSNVFCNAEDCAPTYDFSSAYFYRNDAFYCEWNNDIPTNCGTCYPRYDLGASGYSCDGISATKVQSRNEIFVQVNGDYTNSAPDTSGWNADRLTKYEEAIVTEPEGNCSGAHVEDPIQFNKDLLSSDKLHSKDKKGACTEAMVGNLWETNNSISRWGILESCYEAAKNAHELYDDEWLLIELEGGNQLQNLGSEILTHKYIIIMDETGTFSLPPTTSDAMVLFYLKKGGYIEITKIADYRNFFVYSDGDIKYNATSTSTQRAFTGSIFLSECHSMSSVNTISISYNEDLVDALNGIGAICENDGTGKCSNVSSSSSSSEEEIEENADDFGGMDSYYISTSPQLGISLESQYQNRENLVSGVTTEVNGSFIVLPRVIYLAKDPKGQLSDYYNVVALNSKDKVQSPAVSCDYGSLTSGLLYSGTELNSGYYKCSVSGTVKSITGTTTTSTVPFYVVISGSGSSSPSVSFEKSNVELAIGNATTVNLKTVSTTTSATTYDVTVAIPSAESGWSIVDASGNGCSAGSSCVVQVSTNSGTSPVVTVTNNSAATGTLLFQIIKCDGCTVGSPSTETISNSANATINREDLAAYCSTNTCDETYTAMADESSWPNCTTGNEWVTVSGSGCSVSSTNNSWTCDVTSDVSLTSLSTGVPTGCTAVIPSVTLAAGSMTANQTYSLYGSLKATKSKQKVKISKGGKTLASGGYITVDITGSTRSVNPEGCFYSDEDGECTYDAFTGETFSVTIPDEYKAGFGYWECIGSDCPTDINTSTSFEITKISSENTLVAHFNERDQHCFFDEFKTSATCSEENQYCFNNEKSKNYKWYVAQGNVSSVSYTEGYVAMDAKFSRDKSEKTKSSVVIMSSVEAGLYGTLTAQFLVPRKGTRSNYASATAENSGFLLHSSVDATSYLKLSIFTNSSGVLTAKVCSAAMSCLESIPTNGTYTFSPSSTDIVTLKATIKTEDSGDVLSVSITTGSFSNLTTYSTSFSLPKIAGYANLLTRANNYVGFVLSDPNFKLYDIGWESQDYAAQCWDTPPVVKCSFKAAYVGGIVPKDQATLPWVGLSGWFDDKKNCDVSYLYQGTDACYGNADSYVNCGTSYTFSEEGAHGYVDASEKDVKTAKVNVDGSSCSYTLTDYSSQLLAESAHCGSFWVGEQESCFDNVVFTTTDNEYWYYNSGSVNQTANLRDASLTVVLENTYSSEVQIYLISKSEASSYIYGAEGNYSLPITTTGTGTLLFDLTDVANQQGFDIEKVYAVVVKNMDGGTAKIKQVYSTCENTLELSACYAKYDLNSLKWTVSANVQGWSGVSNYSITGVSEGSGSYSYSNNAATAAHTNATSLLSTEEFSWEDNELYASHTGEKVSFTVTATGKHGETASCQTPAVEIGSASAGCLITTTSVVEGSGKPIVSYALTSCPDENCGYKLSLDDGTVLLSGKSGAFTTKEYQSLNTTENPLTAGTYTVTLSSTNASRPFDTQTCGTFTVTERSSESVDEEVETNCWFTSTDVLPGYDAYFKISNNSKVMNKKFEVKTSEGISVESGNLGANGEIQVTIPGSYTVSGGTFILYVTDKVSCTAALSVKSLSPTCEEITEGDGNKFKVSFPLICGNNLCSYEVKKTYGETTTSLASGTISQSEYKIPMTGYGNYVLWLNGEETSCSVNKVEPAPEFTCPDNVTAVAATSNNVKLTLGNVTNCDGGCDYSISGSTISTVTGTNYSGGSLKVTDNITAAGNTASYAVSLANATGTVSHDCNVAFEATAGCHCEDYCGAGCASAIQTGNISNSSFSGCVFFTSATRINVNAADDWKINNLHKDEKPSDKGCYSSEASCANYLSALVSKVDGGYYFHGNNIWVELQTTGYNPCAEIVAPTVTCPSSIPEKKTSSTVSISPASVTGCDAGCDYSIKENYSQVTSGSDYTGGSISFTGSSEEGTKNYTLEVTNSKGSADCSFDVKFGDDVNEEVTDNQEHTYADKTCLDIHSSFGYDTDIYMRCVAEVGTRRITYSGSEISESNQYNGVVLKIGHTTGDNHAIDATNVCVYNTTGSITCFISNY